MFFLYIKGVVVPQASVLVDRFIYLGADRTYFECAVRSRRAASLGRAHTFRPSLKPWIAAQIGKMRVLPDPDQITHVHLLGFCQPRQGVFAISQAGKYDRQVERSARLLGQQSFEFGNHLFRFGPIPQHCISVSQKTAHFSR